MSEPRVKAKRRRPRRALRFAEESSLVEALDILEELEEQRPGVEYDLVPGATIVVFPSWLFDELKARLEEREVFGEEVEVTPMSELPPQEQSRLRGWSR
jgi:hypothetical protein